MRLRPTSAADEAAASREIGITLVELAVVMGIVVVLFGLGLAAGIGLYQRSTLRAERDNVVGILKKARSDALANVNAASHGAYVSASSYVAFQGDSYAARAPAYDAQFPRHTGLTLGGLSEVDFRALDGSSGASGTIAISNGIQSVSISVNNEGRIDW